MEKKLFVRMVLLMAACFLSLQAMATKAEITVNTPGQMGTILLSQFNQWTDFDTLVVSGHLNESDMKYFASMSNLLRLDLSATDITAISGCRGLGLLEEVALPTTVVTVADNAFQYCDDLKTINLPSATSIGSYAFYSCSSLTSIELPSATSIGSDAFYNCYSLTSIELPSATSIGSYAFYDCSKLTDIFCYVTVPFPTQAFTTRFPTGGTLHVPAFSLLAYKLHPDWGGGFNNIVAMEGDISEVTVNNYFTITSLTGLAEKSSLTVESCLAGGSERRIGHLDIAASEPWPLGKLNFENYKWVTGSRYCNTMITQSEVTADEVELSFRVQTDEWNFISFPFDVKVADIEWPNHTLWAIRKYSGADRAALTGNTWQDMTGETTLQAGEGYILQCTNDSISDTELMIKIHAVDNTNKNRIFSYQDMAQPLNVYSSEYAHNSSWNLVGNPYPSYYDSHAINHNGVITVWNGWGYTAYSLQDDQYVLRPFEAFFVQCPDDEQQMTFAAAGRQHAATISSSPAPAFDQAVSQRRTFNFLLSGNNSSDRTRLVVNPQAKADYEMACDAAKMMSHVQQAAQLYIYDGGIRYAIDERPLGNGVFALGMRVGEAGSYTLQLDAEQTAGCTVVLTDHETGQQTDLTTDSYTFTAKADSNDSRFTIALGGDVTGISEMHRTDNARQPLYDLSGRRIEGTTPSKGLYITKGRKVMLTK